MKFCNSFVRVAALLRLNNDIEMTTAFVNLTEFHDYVSRDESKAGRVPVSIDAGVDHASPGQSNPGQSNADHESFGPIKSLLVESRSSGVHYWAEWLESRDVSADTFRHIRNEWRHNAEQQPQGSLKQRRFWDNDGRVSRILDAPSGQSLKSRMFKTCFQLDHALQIAISLSRCLESWHQRSRIHGWLSSETVFFDNQFDIEIRERPISGGDLKFSHNVSLDELGFVSPEASGLISRPLTAASDFYSLGALLYGMVAGRPFIEAENASDYFEKQLCIEPARLRELGIRVPAALDDLVARLLRRDPRNRYESGAALTHDLEQILLLHRDPTVFGSFAIGTQDVRQELAETPLIGFEAELAQVRTGLETAQNGEGIVTVITGVDVNQRRLFLDEVSLDAKSGGFNVFRGSVSKTSTLKPLQSLEPVLEKITSLCLNDPELAKKVSAKTQLHAPILSEWLPELSAFWPEAEWTIGIEAHGSQRAANALTALLEVIAGATGGVALLFDELDSSDDFTRTVIRAVMDFAAEEQHNPFYCAVTADVTYTLRPYSETNCIQLAPLSEAEVEKCLQSSAGKMDPTITQSITRVADGDPAMAIAVLNRLIRQKVVTSSNSGWIAQTPLHEALRSDDSLAELLHEQVVALTPDHRRLLAIAAVLGEQFNVELLSAISEQSLADTIDMTNDALNRRLLWRDPRPGWFCFAANQIHHQMQHYLRDDEQQYIHLGAVRFLLKHDPTNYFDLAHHYDAAGKGLKAFETAMQAANIARQRYSLSVAYDQLRIALKWVERYAPLAEFVVCERLGNVCLLAGKYEEASEYLFKALEIAHDRYDQARVQQKIGEVAFKRGRFADAATHYELALTAIGVQVPKTFAAMLGSLVVQTVVQTCHSLLPAHWVVRNKELSEVDQLRLQLLSRLSHVYWFSRHKLWTLSNHLRSMNDAERFPPSLTLALVYSEHGPAMSLVRWFTRANHYLDRSLEIRTEMEDMWGQGQSLDYKGVVKLAEGDYEATITASSRAVELLRQTGDVWEMNMAKYQKANALYRTGRLDEAVTTAIQVYESGRNVGDRQSTGIILDVWARALPETLPLERITEEAARYRPDAQSHAQTQLGFARVLLHHNRIDDAIKTLWNAIDYCNNAGSLNTYIFPCFVWLGTAYRLRLEATNRRDGRRYQKNFKAAKKAIRKAVRMASKFPGDLPHALRELGILNAIQGKTRAAHSCFVKSQKVASRMGMPCEELETLEAFDELYNFGGSSKNGFPEALAERLEQLRSLYSSSTEPSPQTATQTATLSLADRFSNVLKSGRRIAQALSSDLVYTEARDAARRLLRGQHVDIVKIEVCGDQITTEILSDDIDDSGAQSRVAKYNHLIEQALATHQAVCTAPDPSPLHETTGSAIAAPIAFHGDPVAIILVTHYDLKDLYGCDEQRIADFVTTIAGAALENADGFLRLKQINDTLEQRVLERTQAAEDRARQLTISNEQLLDTEDNLKRAIVQANAANEAKSRFLATISHEIRTPLNGILGMTCLASKATEDSRLIGYLNSVELSGQSLLTLINDLLDFSKLEAGKMELEQIPTDLSQVAGEVCRLLAASAWQKNLELVCDLDPFLPRTVIGDPSRIRQILMNLVGNAIKFTETGHICLAIRTIEESSDCNTIQFTVQDSGIGIAHEHIDKVFESFSQSDSSMTRRYGGTGLGLAICRELAVGMEGTIDVESEFGNGSTFTVTLSMPTVNQERLVEPIAIFPPPQVMIIDPLPASQHAIANALKPIQAKTMACSPNPRETSPSTIDKILQRDLDLVICSGEIPDQVWNYCSTTQTPTLWIRSGTSTTPVPAVPWLTEIRSPALCPEILAAAAEMLQYPRRQLSDDNAPAQAIAPKNETITKQLPEPTATVNEPVSTDPPARTRSPRILVAEDGVINREVISGILEMQAYVAVLAKDGVEAVEIADQEEFDICLMDVDMPRMDGIEATRMIRMRDIPTGARRFPIVAMTAHSDDQIWASCKEAGMDAYISKPIQPEKLFETIQALCNETAPPITTPV